MPHPRRRRLPLWIAGLLLGAAPVCPVFAIGLGDIETHSWLGRPLEAEIALHDVGDLDATQLKVTLGSAEEYRRLNVEQLHLHSEFRIEQVERDGRAFVRVTTRSPVVEPYLDFVLTLRWPHGQLAREFTILLDPPPVEATASASPSKTRGVDHAIGAAPSRVARHEARQAAAAPLPDSYTTRRGDSLWVLARHWREPGSSVEATMAAVVAANPEAFINGDAARLKEGVTLRRPRDTLSAAVAAAPAVPVPIPVPMPAPSDAAAAPAGQLEVVQSTLTDELLVENVELKNQVVQLAAQVGQLAQSLEESRARFTELEARFAGVLDSYDRQRAAARPAAWSAPAGITETGAVPALASSAGYAGPSVAPLPASGDSGWLHGLYAAVIAALLGWMGYRYWRERNSAAVWAAGSDEAPAPLDARPSVSTVAAPLPRVPNVAAPVIPTLVGGRQGRLAESEPFSRRAEQEAISLSRSGEAGVDGLFFDRVDGITTADAAAQPLELDETAFLESGLEQPASHDGALSVSPMHATEVDLPELDDLTLDGWCAEEVAPGAEAESDDGVDATLSAGVFIAFGRFDEAERVLQEALARDPARSDLQLQLLDLYLQAGASLGEGDQFERLVEQMLVEHAADPAVMAELAALREAYDSAR